MDTKPDFYLARAKKDLELFELPFDTPTMLAAGCEVLWQPSRNVVIHEGRSYQLKSEATDSLEILNWDQSAAPKPETSLNNSITLENLSAKPDLTSAILDQLRLVYDPEISVNIVELGLIYGIRIAKNYKVTINLTLTNPACNMSDFIIAEIKAKLKELETVKKVEVRLVFDPPWSYDRLSEEAKLALGII